ncbi:MAG: ABC transporter permease [Bacteroidota bacterium]|nr:ABC transporter permease [Bacteroidota bacterium]
MRYILRRIASAIPLLFGLVTVTFIIVHLAPGDPTALFIDRDADPSYAQNLKTALGLDQPLHIQYFRWLKQVATGDFGFSFTKNAPVSDLLAEAVPRTLLLSGSALAVNFLMGIAIGIFTALRRGTRFDRWVNTIALFMYSMPEFWLGLMLIFAFSLAIPIFPASGCKSPLAEYLPWYEYILDVLQHLVLPVVVLGVASAAATARYVRGSMLDVIQQDYIRTARAKGLGEISVIGKHALRNALIPVVTLFGLSFPFLLGGAVIVETVFAWPGMGKMTVDAIFTRDYPMIIATTLVSGTMVIAGNLLADILYALIDPRIRLGGEG